MSKVDDHPTVKAQRARTQAMPACLTAQGLRELCLTAGADDVGFVSIDRPELDLDRQAILRVLPATKSVIGFVIKMNIEPVRSPARNIANLEFHHAGDRVNDVAHQIVAQLQSLGIRALNPPMAFPMEMDGFPGKVWSVSLKPLAVAAGLGHMGIHRNVIHPKFGNFVLLGSILLDWVPDHESQPIDYNPCLDCKLCVAACPVGAISPEGEFNFSSCYTHNYREFMGGFTDWVETVADSGSAREYRKRVTIGETVSMWQSLAFGSNYKAAYCMSVCPAGEDVIGPFLENRATFLKEIVRPLQQQTETIYVLPNSDAEAYVAKRFPHKRAKCVGPVLQAANIEGFIASMRHGFQPGKSQGLSAVYHFHFTGNETAQCTITISDQKIEVQKGLLGTADLTVRVDSKKWLRFLRKEIGVPWMLLTRALRLKGNPKLLVAFGKCFP
jgi:NAD-dependent dihydropyrimidine dehydrogenase PreA subunit